VYRKDWCYCVTGNILGCLPACLHVFIVDFKDIRFVACDETFVSDIAIIGRQVDLGDDAVESITGFSLIFAFFCRRIYGYRL